MFLRKMFSVIILLFIQNIAADLDVVEDSPCEWNGVNGTCVNVRRCASVPYDYEQKDPPPICSFDGLTPIVCCTDCDILGPNELIKDPLDREYYHTEHKYLKKCFEYQYSLPYQCKTKATFSHDKHWEEERKCYTYSVSLTSPVGGVDASRGDFPHMALLGYGPDMDSAQWLCGGSLISSKFILTAAHCGRHIQFGPVGFVALGMLKRSDPPQYWKRYSVRQFIPHPRYKAPGKYHDIALVETNIFMRLADGIYPACLTHKFEIEGDDVAFATGWGSLGPNKPNSDVLQNVTINKFSKEVCSNLYPIHRHLRSGYNETTQMCYGNKDEARDTCQGDSGGPLQMKDPKARHCVAVVFGVTSTGLQCGSAGVGGLYTRVSYYISWIESIVWP